MKLKKGDRETLLWGGIGLGALGLALYKSKQAKEPFQDADTMFYAGFRFFGSLARFKEGIETVRNITLPDGVSYKTGGSSIYDFLKLITLGRYITSNVPNSFERIKICIFDASTQEIVYDMFVNILSQTDTKDNSKFPPFPETTEEKEYIFYTNIFNPVDTSDFNKEICYVSEVYDRSLVNSDPELSALTYLPYDSSLPKEYENACIKPDPNIMQNVNGYSVNAETRAQFKEIDFEYGIRVMEAGGSQTIGPYLDIFNRLANSTSIDSIYAYIIQFIGLYGYVTFREHLYEKPFVTFTIPSTAVTRTLPVATAGFTDYSNLQEPFASGVGFDVTTLYTYDGLAAITLATTTATTATTSPTTDTTGSTTTTSPTTTTTTDTTAPATGTTPAGIVEAKPPETPVPLYVWILVAVAVTSIVVIGVMYALSKSGVIALSPMSAPIKNMKP